jgi:anti-anti-sigma factor
MARQAGRRRYLRRLVPDRSSFELTEEDVGDGVRVVVLRGDADRFHAAAVTEAIAGARADGRAVVVDMAQTTFMDSSMLAALVAASEGRRVPAGSLALVVGPPRLRRSLGVKGLGAILTVADSREKAVELVRSA